MNSTGIGIGQLKGDPLGKLDMQNFRRDEELKKRDLFHAVDITFKL